MGFVAERLEDESGGRRPVSMNAAVRACEEE
jgi:hypothetical protein